LLSRNNNEICETFGDYKMKFLYKCYKCGLSFEVKKDADLHTFITKHNFRKIEMAKNG